MISELFEPSVAIISDLIIRFGYAGIIFATFIENIIAPIPSEFLFPWAGFLAYQGELNVLLISLAGAFGALLAAWVLYYLGYAFNGPQTKEFVEKYGKFVFINYEDLKKAEKWFDKYSIWTVFLFRFVPLGRAIVSVPAGFFKMNIWIFSIFTFAGSFIWCFALTYAGFLLGENWEMVLELTAKYETFILTAVGILMIIFIYFKFIKNRNKKPSIDVQE